MIVKVTWELSGQGTIEVDPIEVEGMSDEEIEDYIRDGVELEIHEQGNYHVRLPHLKSDLKDIKEAVKKLEKANG